jgi:hypothetical protein
MYLKNLKTASFFSIGIGVIVLFGWVFNIVILKSIFPGYVNMKINTALCFILSGIVFLSSIEGKWNKKSKIIVLFIIIIALDSILKLDFGNFTSVIPGSSVLFNEKEEVFRSPVITAVCFVCLGISFYFVNASSLFFKTIGRYGFYSITIVSLVAFLTSVNDI